MEVLLALTVAAVGIACLVTAVTFRARAEQHASPLVSAATEELSDLIHRTGQEVHQRCDEIRATVERVSKWAEGSIRVTEQRLASVSQKLEESWASAALESGQIKREMSGRISQLQESVGQLAARDGADKREADAVRGQIGELRESLDRLTARLAAIEPRLAEAKDTVSRSARQVRQVSKSQSVMDRRLAAVLGHVDDLGREVDELNLCVRGWLDHKRVARGGRGAGDIVAGSLSPDPSSAEIVWARCEEFWAALSLTPLFRHPVGSVAADFYLLWDPRAGQSLPEWTHALLRDCPTDAPDTPGLRELRSLLLVLYYGEPAALRMGRMVVTRTEDQLLGGVLPEGDPAQSIDAASLRPAVWAERLRELGPGSVVDLTAWAAAVYAA